MSCNRWALVQRHFLPSSIFSFFSIFLFATAAEQFIALSCHYFILACVFSDTASAPLFLICWLCWFPLFISPSQFRYCSNNTLGLIPICSDLFEKRAGGTPMTATVCITHVQRSGFSAAHMFLLTKWGGRDEHQMIKAHSPNDRGALAVSEKTRTRKKEGKSEW